MKMKFSHPAFKYWPLKKYSAITWPTSVWFATSREETDPEIIRHEEVHLHQIKRLGIFRFYGTYLKEYAVNLIKYRSHDKAYRNISFEREAYGESDGLALD
jgi:hypothetical protein